MNEIYKFYISAAHSSSQNIPFTVIKSLVYYACATINYHWFVNLLLNELDFINLCCFLFWHFWNNNCICYGHVQAPTTNRSDSIRKWLIIITNHNNNWYEISRHFSKKKTILKCAKKQTWMWLIWIVKHVVADIRIGRNSCLSHIRGIFMNCMFRSVEVAV